MTFSLYTIITLLASLNNINKFCNSLNFVTKCRGIIMRSNRFYPLFMNTENSNKINLNSDKSIILEIFTKKTYFSDETQRNQMLSQITSDVEKTDFIAYNSLYKKDKEDKMSVVLDSPVMKVVDLIFNPIALVFTLYFSILGYNKFSSFFSSLRSLLTGKKNKSEDTTTVAKLEELPYQVFECEVCEMQMRPAKGRAEKIFGRDRFRCSRCGSKASSYFNIDDLSDPRAVERIERLAKEKEDEDSLGDDDVDTTDK